MNWSENEQTAANTVTYTNNRTDTPLVCLVAHLTVHTETTHLAKKRTTTEIV